MDIKAKIEEVVEKITKDPNIKAQFQSNPVKAVEGILGIDLPDDVMKKIIGGVKAKLSADKLSGAMESLKKLF